MLILCNFLFLPHGILFSSYWISVVFHTSSQFLGGLENRGPTSGDLHLRAGPRVSTCARGSTDSLEGSKTPNLNEFTLFESIDYGLDEAIDHSCRIGPCQARYLCNLPYDISFGHDHSSAS